MVRRAQKNKQSKAKKQTKQKPLIGGAQAEHKNKYATQSQAKSVAKQMAKTASVFDGQIVGRPPMSRKERRKKAKEVREERENRRERRERLKSSGLSW